jgi:hypothetical protein
MGSDELLIQIAEYYWEAGLPLPVDIEADLASRGFDVPVMQNQWSTEVGTYEFSEDDTDTINSLYTTPINIQD